MRSIISWNCRGIGVAQTVRALRDLVSRYTPSIIFLCETKAKKNKLDHLCRALSFDKCFVVDAVGRSGGLALFWKDNVSISILSSCKNFIHSRVNINAMNFDFLLTGVYGDIDAICRRRIWDKISSFHISPNQARTCMGDFNDVLFQSDKEGLRPRDQGQINQFRNFVDNNRLLDLHLKGCRFTWSNNREEGHVRAKLDRMLCNARWQMRFPNTCVTALPAIGSDHSPLVMQLESRPVHAQKCFKYEEFWEEDEDLPDIINGYWGASDPRNIVKKIDTLKTHLSNWNSSKYRRADVEISTLKKKLIQLENRAASRENIQEIKQCKNRINTLWEREELFWKARSRLKWLRSGDRNSKYFHATTIHRRSINRVSRLRNSTGEWVENQSDLLKLVNDHFSSLFTSTNPTNIDDITRLVPPKISREVNEMLLRPVEEWEIKQAVFDMGPNKAPGPDGLSGLFFQKHWDTVKNDVVGAVRNFFESAQLPNTLNETHVTLIPKIGNPEEVGQFRPISCCNFIYKVMSKFLANRMKNLMKDIISISQSAFVKGRQIQDNIIIAHEIFHSLRSKGGRRINAAVIKLDMSKAYDRIEWKFLESMLKAFGFDSHWVKLIMCCVTSVSYKFKLNGALGDAIIPQRGIRQGDPLSPYLFIIASEGFSLLINEAITNGSLSGIKLSRNGPVLSHLLFADDSMILTQAKDEDAYVLQSILNRYSNASGQRINSAKSELLFSKDVIDRRKILFSNVFGMPICSSPSRYLGLPGEWQGSKVQALTWLKDRIWHKMQGWKEKYLSLAGKEVLIKSVIQAIPNYIMSVFILPKTLCDNILSMITRFWWRSCGKEKGVHWINWKQLKKPKCDGGIGFKDIHAMNIALISKQIWRIEKNPDALWVMLLKSLYFPNSSIWEAKKGNNISWGWRSILQGRDFVNRHKAWHIKDGSSVKLCHDKWVHNGQRVRLDHGNP